MLEIRAETPDDAWLIRAVNVAAFGTPAEADLVDVLREDGAPILSLVAVLHDAIVGHILFSAVRIESEEHGGKGWAVRHGMLATTGQYRFMCDADLAMPIEGLEAFLKRMDEGYDIVIGSRQVAGAQRFNEPMWRHFMGRVFNRCVRLLAVGGFEDTQCGFKF